MNTKIIIAGQEFETNTKVVLWNEPDGFNFYPYKKFNARNKTLEELQKDIKAFYIHYSVTYTAKHMFNGLKSRGLSVNFIIDDDINPETGCATIYQCLDVKDGGWSQGGSHNWDGAGVEISYFPNAWEIPTLYSEANRKKYGVQNHEIVSDEVHGHKFNKIFAPTEAQVKACNQLMAAYLTAFPNIPRTFPKDSKGNIIKTTLKDEKREGILHHYHVKRSKIDTVGYPSEKSEQAVLELLNEKPKNFSRSSIVTALKKIIGLK